MASTPPPPSPTALRVPGAPRHGAGYDLYSPYPTRYSTRLAGQRASRTTEQTPPPNCPGSPTKRLKSSPRKQAKDNDKTLSPPDTGSHDDSSNPSTSGSNYRTTNGPTMSFPRDHPLASSSSLHSSTFALPTPAKTPSKKKVSSDLSSTARTLFPSSTMSSKKSPLSLDSFDESKPGQKEIEIFTDSRDRIPKASTSDENPFGAQAPRSPQRATRASRAEQRKGIRYNFRGKTFIQDFSSDEEDENDDSDNDLGLFSARPDLLEGGTDILKNTKTLSRSSIKPRNLWPSATPKPALEEEAPTDDEDATKQVADPFSSPVTTPKSPEFPQAPGASRLLRSSARLEDGVHATPTNSPGGKRKRNSPFDCWQRKKGKEGGASGAPASPLKQEAGRDGIHPASKPETGSTTCQTPPRQLRRT